MTPARWPLTLDEEDNESAAGSDLTAGDRDAAVAWAAARWRKNKNPFFYNCPSGTKETMSCSAKHKDTSTLDSQSLCFDIYTCDVF